MTPIGLSTLTLTPREHAYVFGRVEAIVDQQLAKTLASYDARWQARGWPPELRDALHEWLELELVFVKRDALNVVRQLLLPRCVH